MVEITVLPDTTANTTTPLPVATTATATSVAATATTTTATAAPVPTARISRQSDEQRVKFSNVVGEPPPPQEQPAPAKKPVVDRKKTKKVNEKPVDVLHPPKAEEPRKIYHYPTGSGKASNRPTSLFERIFGGCCSSRTGRRLKSFMIVAEKDKSKSVVDIPVEAKTTPATKSQPQPQQQDQQTSSAAVVSNANGGEASSCSQQQRKPQPKTNGILKQQTASFKKNNEQRLSQEPNFYQQQNNDCRFLVEDNNEFFVGTNNMNNSSTRSNEHQVVPSGTNRPTSVHIRRPPSPSSQSEIVFSPSSLHISNSASAARLQALGSTSRLQLPGLPSPYSNNCQQQRATSRRQQQYPVEIHEIDETPPSLEPRVTTRFNSEDETLDYDPEEERMASMHYSSSNCYQHRSSDRRTGSRVIPITRPSRSQERRIRSEYMLSDPEPITATATVSAASALRHNTEQSSRSRSIHCRQQMASNSRSRSPGYVQPIGATLLAAEPNTVTIKVAGPPKTTTTTRYNNSFDAQQQAYYRSTNQLYNSRTPSPEAAKIRVDTSPSRHSSRKVTYAPTPTTGRGEHVSVNAGGARQQNYTTANRSKSPVPQIPVGSKIDVTMRSHHLPKAEPKAKHGSSLRYTYETEFEATAEEELCGECDCNRQSNITRNPPKQHHRQASTGQQYSTTTNVKNAARVQVGDVVDEYRSVYHTVKNTPAPKPLTPCVDNSDQIRNKTVVVTKQVKNKQSVLDALASTRRKLDQLDGDLEAALKRIQDRNNRSDSTVTTSTRRRPSSPAPATAPKPSSPSKTTTAYLPISTSADFTISTTAATTAECHSSTSIRRESSSATSRLSSPSTSNHMPMGSNIVLITIADDGSERFEESEQIIYSRSPPIREVMVCQPPRRVEVVPPKCRTPTPPPIVAEPSPPISIGPDQFDYTDRRNVAVISPYGTLGNIFHQLTHGKLPDFVHQRFNVEHSEEEIHNNDVDLCHADGSDISRLEGFQNLDTIYEIINMGIENAQAKIQSAPGESVRMIMSHDVDSAADVTTREKQLDTKTTAWAVAEILSKTMDQQGNAPISPRSVEDGPMKFLSPSRFAEEVYSTDILGQNGKEVAAVQFSTRSNSVLSPRSGGSNSRPWTSDPPPAYRPTTFPIR